MLKLSALVILGMDWLTQLIPRTNWVEITIEWTSNNTKVFLEACGLYKTYASVGPLNLIGGQQLNNLVRTTKGQNVLAWIVQCSAHSKLNATNLEKLRSLKSMYLCSNIGI